MLTHHVAKTWSFLKGHGRAVHMSPSPAAPLRLTDGFHLVNVFKPCSFDTCINPGSSEWQSRALLLSTQWRIWGSGSWPKPALTCDCTVPPGALMLEEFICYVCFYFNALVSFCVVETWHLDIIDSQKLVLSWLSWLNFLVLENTIKIQ